MYAVGRLISRSIYTVSGPFHPFGGAVDIVVVEQPDGSYKSSPWYVRFGKFQGVLKRREKVVSICVNGVDAEFHMYLDHTGEAYFLEEVEEEVEEIVVESSLSSELTNEDLNSHTPMKSLSCNFDAEGSLIDSPETGSGRTRTGSKRARLLGLVFGRRLSQGEPSPDIGRANSLDRAEIAADLLDANWSTELALDKPKLQNLSLSSENLILNDECFVNGDSLDQNLALTSVDESLIQETSGLITEFSQEFSELHIQVRADEQRREKARMLTDTDPLSPCLVECPSDIKSLQEIDTSVAKEFNKSQQAPQSNESIFGTEVKLTESVKTSYTKQISGESLLCKDDVIDCEGTPLIEDSCNLKVKSEVRRKVVKKMMRSITPASAQLKSLSLNEGGNLVTFTFSTAMLGKQQVDARIYLWKWDARIVISDVDGTITKSDVLGQFMPMVGYDWSHIGVTHLFSAIKENGYQLLFLSARSISQSYITRQFLFNLKQDGKTLPDGPVVISPDGLFPSLYREVIRRAPHEFKIACLEDIKALFPPECNPFYAGFGNRDTDEISYLKVGIPKGKIFIINPKGEVKVHRRVDTNSYSDLHTLANGMFPPICSSEQEDFNTWNFWKLPPCMDLEL